MADNGAGKKKTEQEGIEDLKKEINMVCYYKDHNTVVTDLCVTILG